MRRTYVVIDFSAVEPAHAHIDARLHNWSRWARGRGAGADCSPMFRLYRPPRQWDYVLEAPQQVDALDAAKVQRAVTALPEKHRLALSWCYITQGRPRRAAQRLGVSEHDLADLVRDGRQMLINRRV